MRQVSASREIQTERKNMCKEKETCFPDLLQYEGKTCIVTGSSSGMGKAVCQELIAQGAEVYGLDRNPAETDGLKAFVQADLSDKSSIDNAFARLPQSIDCFFGAAGLSEALTDWKTTFTVDYTANKYITEQYLENRMGDGGAIVYVTSTGGLKWENWSDEYIEVIEPRSWEEMDAFMEKACPNNQIGPLGYSLAKRALNYYTNYKAIELAPRGIRVNAVLPGSTDTGMKKEFEAMVGGEENLKKENGSVGRLATPAEMADPILFLGSNMARFISGQLLIVDMGNNCEVVLGKKESKLDIPVTKLPGQ